MAGSGPQMPVWSEEGTAVEPRANPPEPEPPWASGPREILQHGLMLLADDTDTNRRLAMLSIDNAVELMMKTYLGLPKRVTGLSISRSRYREICDSFPTLLDAMEEHASGRLQGVDLGEIEWYHRLRNQLYHQGNGLTVERRKVEVYAELAKILSRNLFDHDPTLDGPPPSDQLGDFLVAWYELEKALLALCREAGLQLGRHERMTLWRTPYELAQRGIIDESVASEMLELRHVRNRVIHDEPDASHHVRADTVGRIRSAAELLARKLEEIERRSDG